MLHLIENITSALDRKELAIGIFLDLSKAFDTINHQILFDKLYHKLYYFRLGKKLLL